MPDNPYATPATTEFQPIPDSSGKVLAGRFTRFAAAMVDGILLLVIVLPIQFATGFMQRTQLQQVGMLEQLGMAGLGLVTMLLLNGYLLATRGQTIGKLLTKIQIVDFKSNALLPLHRVYVMRYLWTFPFVIVSALIPGPIDDMSVNLLCLVDVLFIFNSDRRCLHDFIAGSSVVEYRSSRSELTS